MAGVTRFSRGVRGVALASVVLAVVLLAAVSALANHVDPVTVGPGNAGNPKCPAGMNNLEIQSANFANGQRTDNDGPLVVTISAFNGQTSTFNWSSNIGVDQVIVKGGDFANVYTYNPESTGDTGLHTPLNQNNGQNYGLSHVLFCYDVEQTTSPSPSESESESPSPSVSPSETETPGTTPSESVSVLPTETETSPGATVLGKKLSATGADVIRLALFALALLVLGVAAYVVSTRAARNNR